MQVARLNRVARDFQLLVQSAALFLEHGARDAEGRALAFLSAVKCASECSMMEGGLG
jgi:hypothetical protein